MIHCTSLGNYDTVPHYAFLYHYIDWFGVRYDRNGHGKKIIKPESNEKDGAVSWR